MPVQTATQPRPVTGTPVRPSGVTPGPLHPPSPWSPNIGPAGATGAQAGILSPGVVVSSSPTATVVPVDGVAPHYFPPPTFVPVVVAPLMMKAGKSRVMRADIAAAWVVYFANQAIAYIASRALHESGTPTGVITYAFLQQLFDANGMRLTQILKDFDKHFMDNGIVNGVEFPPREKHPAFKARVSHKYPRVYLPAGPFKQAIRPAGPRE